MTDINLEELKRLAKLAMSGKWYAHKSNVWSNFNETEDDPGPMVAMATDGQFSGGNAAYIAAANPQPILELLSKTEQLERELEEARKPNFAERLAAAQQPMVLTIENAARYEWLRKRRVIVMVQGEETQLGRLESLDSAIDAARKESK